ncbi:MAG: HD domain-containing protein [Thaumarchaeota archaeon]|nr:HD domain-containing protein [Nitrososphaerota archaeon]
MKNQYVKDLQKDNSVCDYFAVSSKMPVSEYKNGYRFSFKISDKTGSINANFWGRADKETVSAIQSTFEEGDVVLITGGKTNIFNDKLVININEGSGEVKKTEDFDIEELVVSTTKNIPEMITKFYSEIESIKNEDIKRLLKSIFSDDFMKKYSKSPAAKIKHHNYVGGLLEHVLSMIAISKIIADQYEPDLDVDLMIAGCMLHDVGKIFEYETKITVRQTIEGYLLGHIPIGAKMVESEIDKLNDFPRMLKNNILHMILSHHGKLEHGSPVVPHFPEAVALSKIDDCDAQTKNALQENS